MRHVILDIDFMFPVDGSPFWRDRSRLSTVFGCVLNAGLGVELNFHQVEDECQPLPRLERLLEESDRWCSGGHRFTSSEERFSATAVDLTIVQEDLRLMVMLSKDHLATRPDAYERFVDLAVKLQADLGHSASFRRGALRATGIDWVRPARPCTGDGWSLGVPALFVSKSYYGREDARRPQDLSKLMDAVMPEGGRREDWGDILALRFARSLDESEIIAAAARQDAWISEVLDLPFS